MGGKPVKDIFINPGPGQQWIQAGMVIFLLLLICSAGIFPVGCGRKTSPVPPDQSPLPAIEDLAIERLNGRISLSWTIADDGEDLQGNIDGFYVYRAVLSGMLADCEECPKQFRQVAAVPFREANRIPEKWSFVDSPPPDAACFYRVRGFRPSGETGPASRSVRVVIKDDRSEE